MSSEAAWSKLPEVAVYECFAGKAKKCIPFSQAQSITSIFRCQDNEIFIGGFTKRTKYLNPGIKLSFWIHSAAIESGGGLSRSSAFMLLLGNSRR
jgi:hypothetical protein